MITQAIENLEFLARHSEREADRLEQQQTIGGDYETCNLIIMPAQLTAPSVLRQRAARYRDAASEMTRVPLSTPAPIVSLDPRPSRRLLLTAAICAGFGAGFLAYMFVTFGH